MKHNLVLVIGEVKKSSHFKESARMQLAFYLKELQDKGVQARGELRFPEKKRKETLILDEPLTRELDLVEREILGIIHQDLPPPPQKISWCKNCAYAEFCWS